MKTKIILSVLFLFACLSQVRPAEKTLDPELEKRYWRFIKERLFDEENDITSRFQENIYILLQTDDSRDSIIVDNLLEELQTLIPNKKFGYCTSILPQTNLDEIIVLNVIKKTLDPYRYPKHSKNINGNQAYEDGFKGVYQPEIYMQQIYLLFNDSASFTLRKQYIEYTVVRSMCTMKGNSLEAQTLLPYAILNRFDYEPYGTTFSEVDKFLLKKLYSDDFLKQFKHYLNENYSRKYARAFLYKNQFQSIKIFVAIIITLLVIVLGYKRILFRKYKRRFLGYLSIGLVIAFTGIIIHLVLQNIAGTGIYGLETNLILSSLILMISLVITSLLFLLEFWLIRPNYSFTKQIGLKVFLLFMLICIPAIVVYLAMPEMNIGRMINFITLGLVLAVGRGLLLYLKELGDSAIRKKDYELMQLKAQQTKAEIQSLNAKINPHFLYNSLNSIAGMARTSPQKTEQMAIALSEFYKNATNRTGKLTSTIHKEMEMVSAYLEIEKIRFGARLQYQIHIDAETRNMLIPRNIIQPLVENAIKHGISQLEKKGQIKINIQKTQGGIKIEVEDNGPSFNEGLGSGFGLQSIQDILALQYQGNAQVSWQNQPQKKVIVEINTNLSIEA